jgi:hypothetical protein
MKYKKCKKCISVLLASLVFLANIGLSFTVHYCNDSIASISLNTSAEESCSEKAVSCCAAEKNHHKCCSDKVVKVKKKKDIIISKSFKIGFEQLAFQQNTSFNTSKKQIYDASNESLAFYCDSNAPPFYKLNCQLVFYA